MACCTEAIRGGPEEVFKKGKTGEHELRLQMPTALIEDYGEDLARARIAEQLRQKEREAHEKSKRSGRAFLGVRRVLQQPFHKRASSHEVFTGNR